jgi:putative two-component system response regulator
MKAHILFVDDDVNVLESLRRSLHAYADQWELHFAHSGEQALDRLAATPCDTVVSDIGMPGMDGFGLLAEICSRNKLQDIPVIIVTGSQESDLKRRALDLGATDLLNKPVEREDLIARLRNTLRLKTVQDELRVHNALLDQKVQERTQELEESRLDIIWRLGRAAEFRDEQTGNHVIRVGYYCRAIAEALGMPGKFVEMLSLASPLHDIGKIGIPDAILFKRGKLTHEEQLLMQTHCTIGARILRDDPRNRALFSAWQDVPPQPEGRIRPNPLLEMATNIALMHHERWDGNGYPHRLKGGNIVLEASIVAVADVYDALSSERPYKPAYAPQRVFEIIKADIGQHFDPFVFAGFEKALRTLREIQFQLQDNELRSQRENADAKADSICR